MAFIHAAIIEKKLHIIACAMVFKKTVLPYYIARVFHDKLHNKIH